MGGIYPDNFEAKIGFDRIRELLKGKCLSSLGEEYVDRMHFETQFPILQEKLGETDEFLRIIREFPQFPADNYFDVRKPLNAIRIEGRFIETEDLFDLKRTLETIRTIVIFFGKEKVAVLPLLRAKTQQIRIYPYIPERIDAILNKFGKIRDNATPELAQIRREILTLQSSVTRRLHLIMKQAQQEGWVEEGATVSIRDGRAVIPVPSAHKRKLKGIVFDESATGKTSFIEPADVVEMNNEIRELEYAERREIIRILINISNDIRPYIDDLINSIEFLGEVDFIRAKALLAQSFGAIKPDFSDQSLLDWKQAIHPLLNISLRKENRIIVPLDIFLNSENHLLVISGPNAGGKSVCLKTVGLLQYMLQNGMLVPVMEGSKTGIFFNMFIDIGDEQSIENDLSTYSSHLMNMKYFLRNCDDRTLILIDEFGSGTEPMLGGAIAEAILGRFNSLNSFGVITTHYTNLKHFAASVPGILNGAMLYDSQKMDPMFKLEIGKPGSSFAFEIARKIGLPEDILQEATAKVGKKQIDFDKNLRSITRDKFYWETKRQKIKRVEKSVDETAESYKLELLEIRQQRKEILKKAREEAQQLLAGVNRQIENAIREIRESQAEKETTRSIRNQLEEVKKTVNSPVVPEDEAITKKLDKLVKREVQRKKETGKKTTGVDEKQIPALPVLKPGDSVRIKGQEATGELISFNDKSAVVAFGQMLSTIAIEKLEWVGDHEPKAGKVRGRSGIAMTLDYSERRLDFKTEIDLRGERAEDALARVQNFIDDAIMFDVRQLRILHGKGNGILKEMIRNYLRSEPAVKSFRDEHVQFGGAGITVVELAL